VLTVALAEALTPERAATIAEVVVRKAEAGEPWAVQAVWDRLEGKAIARTEEGAPGDFTGLEDVPTAELLRLVQGSAVDGDVETRRQADD
jgi:hypothetical protein